MKIFHISVSWCFLTGVWETVSHLNSLGLFSIFLLMVSTFWFISKSSIPFTNPLGIVPCALITIGIIVIFIRVFANGLETSIQSQFKSYQIPQKIILDATLLNTQHYKIQIKDKWSNPGSFPIPWCSSYWKGSSWVALNYGRLTYYYLTPCKYFIPTLADSFSLKSE